MKNNNLTTTNNFTKVKKYDLNTGIYTGNIVFPNGNVFEGTFKKPDTLINGTMRYKNGDVFKGNFHYKTMPNIGQLTYKNGNYIIFETNDWDTKKGKKIYKKQGMIFEGKFSNYGLSPESGTLRSANFGIIKKNISGIIEDENGNIDVYESSTVHPIKNGFGATGYFRLDGKLDTSRDFRIYGKNCSFENITEYDIKTGILNGTLRYDNGNIIRGTFKDFKPYNAVFINKKSREQTVYRKGRKAEIIPEEVTINEENFTFKGQLDNETGNPKNGTMKYKNGDELSIKQYIAYDNFVSPKEINEFMGKDTERISIIKGKMMHSDGIIFDGTLYMEALKCCNVKLYNGDIIIGNKKVASVINGKLQKPYTTFDGNKFVGTLNDNKPSKGVMFYKNNDMFIGTFDENGRPLKGKMIYNNGDIFMGDFIEGRKKNGTYVYCFMSYNEKSLLQFEGDFNDRGEPLYGKMKMRKYDLDIAYRESNIVIGKLTYTGDGKNRLPNDIVEFDGELNNNYLPIKGKMLCEGYKIDSFNIDSDENVIVYQNKSDNKDKSNSQRDNNSGNDNSTDKFTGTFTGSVDENTKPIEGRIDYENGDYFIGAFMNGLRKKGTFIFFKEGIRYTSNGTFSHAESLKHYYITGMNGRLIYTKDGKEYVFNGDMTADGTPLHGEMIYPNNSKFKGKFKKGRPYSGDLLRHTNQGEIVIKIREIHDDPYGIGEVTYPSGDYFYGTINDGKPFYGEMQYKDGKKFKGYFYNDTERPSEGKMKYPNGEEFEGVLRRNIASKGKMKYPNGNVFDGEFDEDGLPYTGTWTIKHKDKEYSVYIEECEIKKCKIVEANIIPDNDNSNKIEFTPDFMVIKENNGEESLFYPDGNIFTGKIDEITKQPKKGTLINTDNTCFKGEFDKEFNCNGKVTYENGDIFTGQADIEGKKIEGMLTNKNNPNLTIYIKNDENIKGFYVDKQGGKHIINYDNMFKTVEIKSDCGKFYNGTIDKDMNYKNGRMLLEDGQEYKFKEGKQEIVCSKKGNFFIIEENGNIMRTTKDRQFNLMFPGGSKYCGSTIDSATGDATGWFWITNFDYTEYKFMVKFDKDGKPETAMLDSKEITLYELYKGIGEEVYKELISPNIPKEWKKVSIKKQEEKVEEENNINNNNGNEQKLAEDNEVVINLRNDNNIDRSNNIINNNESIEEENIDTNSKNSNDSIELEDDEIELLNEKEENKIITDPDEEKALEERNKRKQEIINKLKAKEKSEHKKGELSKKYKKDDKKKEKTVDKSLDNDKKKKGKGG